MEAQGLQAVELGIKLKRKPRQRKVEPLLEICEGPSDAINREPIPDLHDAGYHHRIVKVHKIATEACKIGDDGKDSQRNRETPVAQLEVGLDFWRIAVSHSRKAVDR